MEILLLFILILLNGIFSMTEIALVSAKFFKLEKMKNEGVKGANTAIELKNNPNKFLSTIQIGITLIGILLGVFSGDKISWKVSKFLTDNNIFPGYAPEIGTFVVVLAVTFFSILLGELFPKRVGMSYPESIAVMFSRPMNWLSKITKPFVALLTGVNRWLCKVFKVGGTDEGLVTEEEIKAIIRDSTEEGEIQEIEEEIVVRVFELGDRKVKTLSTYKSDIIFFDENDDWETVKRKINNNKHSAYPVVRNNNIDEILGMVLIKDLFVDFDNESFDIMEFTQDALFIDENTYAYNVLQFFKQNKVHYAIITDEYGATQGMVTMDDLLDALVGDSPEFYQETPSIVQRDDHSWILDGKYPILDFNSRFNLGLDPNQLDYTTLAGMLIQKNGQIPEVGNIIEIPPYSYEIMDKDGQRIDKVLVTKLADNESEGE